MLRSHFLPCSLLALTACAGPSSTLPADSPSAGAPAAAGPAAPASAPIDQQNGFRTHHFGDALATFPGLVPSPYPSVALPEVREYELPAAREQLHIGSTQLRQVHYFFYQGRFYQVSLLGAGFGSAGLLTALSGRYGSPHQPNPYQPEYWWRGQRASASLIQHGSDPAQVLLWSNALRQQADAAQQRATQRQGQRAGRDL